MTIKLLILCINSSLIYLTVAIIPQMFLIQLRNRRRKIKFKKIAYTVTNQTKKYGNPIRTEMKLFNEKVGISKLVKLGSKA